MIELDKLTPEQLDPLVGTNFAVDGMADALTLLQVERLQSPSPRAQPFSLLFVSRTHRLAQATCHLAHPMLGALDVFLVPIQPDARGALYEAVFN